MAEQFKNLVSTTLAEDLDDTEMEVDVASAMGFTGGDFRILIDSEIMKVTGVSGTTLTVVRGQEGTAAASHTSSTAVYHILTAGALDAHDQNDLAAYDTYANRPAAGTPGRIFLPTDGAFIERDDGSSWTKFGPIWPMTPPAPADFPTWLNQGTSTCVNTFGPMYFCGAVSTSALWRAVLKTYPTPPFTVVMAFLPIIIPYNFSSYVELGLCIRDSTSGKMEVYGLGGSGNDMNIRGYYFTSPTATSGTSVTGWPSGQHFSESPLVWIKYVDDSTNRVISMSINGVTWTQLASNSRTSNLTPDQIGIAVQAMGGYTSSAPYFSIDSGISVLHWSQS